MAKDNLLFALYQMHSRISHFEENVARLVEKCHQAARQGARFLVAPELCLGGYPAMDLWARKDFLQREKRAIELLQSQLPADFFVILGTFIDYIPRYYGEQHQSLAIVVLSSDGVQFTHDKTFLPSTGSFYEERYFSPIAPSSLVCELDGLKIGILYYEEFKYSLGDGNFFTQLQKQKVDLVVMITASPYVDSETEARIALIKEHCNGVTPVIYVNSVGGQESLVFDGQSMFVDIEGRVFLSKAFEEDVLYVKPFGKQDLPVAQPLPRYELIRKAIICGLRDFMTQSGFHSVCLGLSGGIDSALVAALAVEALGSENVTGILMPSRYSSEGSVLDAQALAHNLGIETYLIPLEKMHAMAMDIFGEYFGVEGSVEENLQARLRGLYLMTYSNSSGKLLLTTGNKSELAVGYSTLYGDSCGVLSLIGDLWKTRVYELSRYINDEAGRVIIPEETLKKAPSAELRPDQKDLDTLPDYAVLDRILSLYIEKKCSLEDLIRAGHPRADIDKALSLFHKAHFKRNQYAPIIHLTESSFGMGCMWPPLP